MISLKLFRYFSYSPITPLEFESNRGLLIKSSQNRPVFKLLNAASIGIPSLMLLRIISKYAVMGSFNFGFSSLMLFGSVYLSRAWINFSKSFVNEIYLMKSGKYIELWLKIFKAILRRLRFVILSTLKRVWTKNNGWSILELGLKLGKGKIFMLISF